LSISDLAQVRYTKLTRQGSAERSAHWIGTIQYAYGTPATDPRIRRWNPLGFKVVSFRTEPEVLDEGARAKVAEVAP
jgi:type IV secretion system protein VirB8